MLVTVAAIQSQLSTEVLDKMLDARLSQLMGIGFVIISVVVLVVLALFWRMMNGQDKQIRNNSVLIEKLGTLPTMTTAMVEQTVLLRGIDAGLKASNEATAIALRARNAIDDDTKRNLEQTIAQIAELKLNVTEGRKEAVEEVKEHMDDNAKTVDERFATLEQEMKEVNLKLDKILRRLDLIPPTASPETPPAAPADAPGPSTTPPSDS